MMDTEYRRAANITIVAAGMIALAWVLLKYVTGALLPFILAAIISAFISPIAKKIAKRTGLPRKLCVAVILIAVFAGVSALLYAGISRLVMELGRLLQRLSETPEIIGDTIDGILDKLTGNGSHFSFLQKIFASEALSGLGIDIDAVVRDAIGGAVSSLTASLPGAAVSLVREMPSGILFIVVLLIAAYYFASDGGELGRGIKSILPDKWQKKIPLIAKKLKKSLAGYLKAYLLLMLLTFAEMLLGLSILGVEYAFIMAIVISVVDVLPILGTGTVLIPWAIFAFLTSNTPLGVGLLVLYAVTLVVRQFAEPRIVGGAIGVHPLATLASVYIGLKFLGFVGIFAGPIVALLMREMFSGENTENTTETTAVVKK
ncbi:MAG: sporulation integral membrane protein YtvI [Clostridia bacterium]|nr:sporulation integral membrane protein YtvI [Clostridia bacterium]